MDATQAIDWNISVVSPDQEQDDVEVGNLSVSYPDGQKELHRLYAGQNIVSRRSSQSQKDDERLESWRGEYSGGGPVRGIFLDSNSISSPHTNIYLEKRGELCFVKDLGSKNRTFLERGSSPLMLQGGDRYSLNSGDVVRLGNVRCQVEFQTAAPQGEGVAAEGAGAGPMQEDTQAYMSFGQTMEEGEAAGAGAGAEGAAAAAADEEAAGSSGAAAEQANLFVPLTQVEMQPSVPPAAAAGPAASPSAGGNVSATVPLGQAASPNLPAAGQPTGQPAGQPAGQVASTRASPTRTRSRTTEDGGGLSLGFDEGDSIWLPSLTGAAASQQEVMSPPKEDTLTVHLPGARSGNAMSDATEPVQLPIAPSRDAPGTALQEAPQLAEPSLVTADETDPEAGAAPGGGYPAETEAGPSSGSGFSLRPAAAGGAAAGTAEEGTPRIGPDSEEGTPHAAPPRRPGRTARILADTLEDSQGLGAAEDTAVHAAAAAGEPSVRPIGAGQPAEEEAREHATRHMPGDAAEAAQGPQYPSPERPAAPAAPASAPASAGGWRVKRRPAPAPQDAPADAQQGASQAAGQGAGAAADVDFRSQVATKAAQSPRLEYVPPAQQVPLQASHGGWKRRKGHGGASSSCQEQASQGTDPAPALAPPSPRAAAAEPSGDAAPSEGPQNQPEAPAASPSIPPALDQAAEPRQAAVPDEQEQDRAPGRRLWQELLAETEEEGEGNAADVRVAPETTAPAGGGRALGRERQAMRPPATAGRQSESPEALAETSGDAAGGPGGTGLEAVAAAAAAAGQSGPLKSQAPSVQSMGAALAKIGTLAACFPDTQAPAAAAAVAPGPVSPAKGRARRLPATVKTAIGPSTTTEDPSAAAATAAAAETAPTAQDPGAPAPHDTEDVTRDKDQIASEQKTPRPRSARPASAATRRGRGRGAHQGTPLSQEEGLASAGDQAPAAAELEEAAAAKPIQTAQPTRSATAAAAEGSVNGSAAAAVALKRGFQRAGTAQETASAAGPESVAAAKTTAEGNAVLAKATKKPSRAGRGKKAAAAVAQGPEEQPSARAAAGEAAAVESEAAARGSGPAGSKKKRKLTESQTAAETLAQVRLTAEQARCISPVPEEATEAEAQRKRRGGSATGPAAREAPPPARRGRAVAAAKKRAPSVAAAEPEEAAAPDMPAEATAKDQGTAPAKRRKRGAATPPPPPPFASAALAAAAPGAPAGGRTGRKRKAEEELAVETVEAVDASVPPPAKRGRGGSDAAPGATRASAAQGAAVTAAAAARSRKKPIAGKAASKAEEAAAAGSASAASAAAKRGGRQFPAPETQTQGKDEGAACIAAEESAPEPAAAQRGKKRASQEDKDGKSAGKAPEEDVTGSKGRGGKQQPVKRGRKSTATAGKASQTYGGAGADAAALPAPKRARSSAAGAAATWAASLATEAGPSRQLRGADATPPRVLISTCVDAKLRQNITKTIERLGGIIMTSADDFSVFVTLDAAPGKSDCGFTKSKNALSALAAGAPIVSEKWVDACASAGAFVGARQHLLKDPAAEKKFGFSLAAAWEAAQQQLLLSGTRVFLTPGLLAAEADGGAGLRMLVERAGGNIAKTLPKKLPAADTQWLILGDEKSAAKEAGWAKKAISSKAVKVHGRTALINALLAQRIDRSADVLLET